MKMAKQLQYMWAVGTTYDSRSPYIYSCENGVHVWYLLSCWGAECILYPNLAFQKLSLIMLRFIVFLYAARMSQMALRPTISLEEEHATLIIPPTIMFSYL